MAEVSKSFAIKAVLIYAVRNETLISSIVNWLAPIDGFSYRFIALPASSESIDYALLWIVVANYSRG